MKRTIQLVIFLFIVAGWLFPSDGARHAAAQEEAGGENIELIVESDGSIDELVESVQSFGGEVLLQYQNVPAVAVTIPAEMLDELSSLPGVVEIDKDQMVYLADDLGEGKASTEPGSFLVEDTAGIGIESFDPRAIDLAALPEGYANALYTGAVLSWEETGFGEGSVVAVVDTGVVRNACLAHAVTGAPGFPDGFNAINDGIPATDPSNHWHGTHVAGVIASACALDFSANPQSSLYQAIAAYLPWSPDFVPIFGQAPLAQIYPVKVFPASGEGVPSSVVMAGLDHVLSLKKGGLLDVDVVNLSLSGPTVFDGRDVFDRFIQELTSADIFVIGAAGNEGPVPNSVGSPGTSLFSLAAGALDYPPSSRVLYEYLGLVTGMGPGQGLVMRPTDEVRVANFSSRGPASDGRGKPEISALGMWNFHLGVTTELRWASGTSFSAPTVAGVAALLNAYWETVKGRQTSPLLLYKALLEGANPEAVGPEWRNFADQGFGAVDAPAALELLKSGKSEIEERVVIGSLKANVLGEPVPGKVQKFTSSRITLEPGETENFVFHISSRTSRVVIEVFNVVAPDNSERAYWPNSLEFHVQSAKRSAASHPISIYWNPNADGKSFTVEIQDGYWYLNGQPVAYQPMEPGLMKVSFVGDYSNESPVRFRVRLLRENFRQELTGRVARGSIRMGQSFVYPVVIPEGVAVATFDLVWNSDWSKFPTSDLDMIVFDPAGELASLSGATLNAPERAVIENPVPGTWYVYVQGFEMYRPDNFTLYLRTE